MRLLTTPEQVHWSETREFKVLDDTEKEIRVIESSLGTSIFVKVGGVWQEDASEELMNWVENELINEELRLDFENREHSQIKKEHEEIAISDHVVIDTEKPSSDN